MSELGRGVRGRRQAQVYFSREVYDTCTQQRAGINFHFDAPFKSETDHFHFHTLGVQQPGDVPGDSGYHPLVPLF